MVDEAQCTVENPRRWSDAACRAPKTSLAEQTLNFVSIQIEMPVVPVSAPYFNPELLP